MRLPPLAVIVTALASSSLAHMSLAAQSVHQQNAMRSAVVVPAGSAKFGPAPAILPTGAKLAVLDGDPMKAESYTMRLWMPAGYTIPPHFHPLDEHVTVLQGTFLVGMGDKIEPTRFVALPVGSFGMLPPGMRHYARARGVTVVQLHGMGPWSLTYVDPADNPTSKAR